MIRPGSLLSVLRFGLVILFLVSAICPPTEVLAAPISAEIETTCLGFSCWFGCAGNGKKKDGAKADPSSSDDGACAQQVVTNPPSPAPMIAAVPQTPKTVQRDSSGGPSDGVGGKAHNKNPDDVPSSRKPGEKATQEGLPQERHTRQQVPSKDKPSNLDKEATASSKVAAFKKVRFEDTGNHAASSNPPVSSVGAPSRTTDEEKRVHWADGVRNVPSSVSHRQKPVMSFLEPGVLTPFNFDIPSPAAVGAGTTKKVQQGSSVSPAAGRSGKRVHPAGDIITSKNLGEGVAKNSDVESQDQLFTIRENRLVAKIDKLYQAYTTLPGAWDKCNTAENQPAPMNKNADNNVKLQKFCSENHKKIEYLLTEGQYVRAALVLDRRRNWMTLTHLNLDLHKLTEISDYCNKFDISSVCTSSKRN
ncbi:hypothetical protein FB446DRAFT_358949 [Lentinula raphanica]|nr:hypothetical protein FB446DRAFT_358949 [Lentinula raphanica]